jgi:hypothetical protein
MRKNKYKLTAGDKLWQFKNNSWNYLGIATTAQIEALQRDYRLNTIILVDERN